MSEYPRWSVRRITNDSIRRHTPFRWSLDHLVPGAMFVTPDTLFATQPQAEREAVRRNDLADEGIEVRTVTRDNVLGVETTDALGNVAWVTTTEWYGQVDA